jgi:hypothetical protein
MKGGSELVENFIPFRGVWGGDNFGAQVSYPIFQSPIHSPPSDPLKMGKGFHRRAKCSIQYML